jgi:hypothetical protein
MIIQFNRVPGKSYRERKNVEQIRNWVVEIGIFCKVYQFLMDTIDGDESLMTKESMILPYLRTHFICNALVIDLMQTSCARKAR